MPLFSLPAPFPPCIFVAWQHVVLQAFYYARLFARVREKANKTSINSSFLHNIPLSNDLLSVQIELAAKGRAKRVAAAAGWDAGSPGRVGGMQKAQLAIHHPSNEEPHHASAA